MAFPTTLAVFSPTPASRAWARQRAAAEATSSRIAWASRPEMSRRTRQLQQVASPGRPTFSGDGHGVLPAGAGSEDEIVGRRQLPVAFSVKRKAKFFTWSSRLCVSTLKTIRR